MADFVNKFTYQMYRALTFSRSITFKPQYGYNSFSKRSDLFSITPSTRMLTINQYQFNRKSNNFVEEKQVLVIPRRMIYGWTVSFWKPLLFGLIVSGAVLYLANREEVKEYRRKRLQKQHAAIRDPNTPSLLRYWYRLGETNQTVSTLVSMNSIVFLMWQIPGLSNFMHKNFLHTTLSPQVSPLILSTFSHKSFSHLLFNMFALYIYGTHVHQMLGREQFLATYITGGLGAALSSHMIKLAMRDPVPSLGASGAVFAIVASSTYLDPYTRMQFIFLPFFSFTKEAVLSGAVLFDTCGLLATTIFKKNFFGLDHAAHLGGAAAGWFYMNYLYPKKKRVNRNRVGWK